MLLVALLGARDRRGGRRAQHRRLHRGVRLAQALGRPGAAVHGGAAQQPAQPARGRRGGGVVPGDVPDHQHGGPTGPEEPVVPVAAHPAGPGGREVPDDDLRVVGLGWAGEQAALQASASCAWALVSRASSSAGPTRSAMSWAVAPSSGARTRPAEPTRLRTPSTRVTAFSTGVPPDDPAALPAVGPVDVRGHGGRDGIDLRAVKARYGDRSSSSRLGAVVGGRAPDSAVWGRSHDDGGTSG